MMLAMVACFAVMNYLFVRAGGGNFGQRDLLAVHRSHVDVPGQRLVAGEPADRRSCAALAISLVGIGIIVVGGGQGSTTGRGRAGAG